MKYKMAYFDHNAAAKQKECAEKFEELKKYITSIDKKGKINEWFLAHEHIVSLEVELKKQEEELKKYRNFFSIMKQLLPKSSSTFDVIG